MEWPFIGRDSALRRLATAMSRERTKGVEIVGEAGVGKTRLAEQLTDLAREQGRVTETVRASRAMRDLPFGAFAHLIPEQEVAGDDLRVLAALLAELRRLTDGPGSLVLVVDDAHLLDQRSAALVRQLAARGEALVVLTRRSGEGLPQALEELWSDSSIVRLELGPLSEAASRRLVESALSGSVDPLAFQALWSRARGNPLFLRELVAAGTESGSLREGSSGWYIEGDLQPSARLVDAVHARLGRLTAAERGVTNLLAVGGVLSVAKLERRASTATVARLEQRRLIELRRNGNRYEAVLSHPLYVEVLRESLPRSRVRSIQRWLARELGSTGARRRHDLLRLAVWQLEGGGAQDPELFLSAARRALAAFDAVLAERLARAAIGGDHSDLPAMLVLGEALAAQQRVEEADDVLFKASTMAQAEDEHARVALARAHLFFYRAGRPGDAMAVLERAASGMIDPDWRDEIDSMSALMRSGAGDMVGVAEAGKRLAARQGARPRAVVHALVYSTVANAMLGRFDEASAQIDAALELAPEVSEELPFAPELLRINRTFVDCYAGRPAQARDLGLTGYRAAVEVGAADVSALWATVLSEDLMMCGDIPGAARMASAALNVTRVSDPFYVRAIDTAYASILASHLGQADEAIALWREVRDEGLARDVRSRTTFDRAELWVAPQAGGLDGVGAQALAAAERAVAGTHLVWAAFILHDAVRLDQARFVVERLSELAQQLEGPLLATMARHARAADATDGQELDRVASAFERMGYLLFAAEAAAQAHQAHLAGREPRLARFSSARAAFLAERCPGARTPALLQSAPVALTPRERQVARLAAEGHTSPAIAQRMQVSTRTVDNHLGSIYGKLGISARTELASVLGVVAGD